MLDFFASKPSGSGSGSGPGTPKARPGAPRKGTASGSATPEARKGTPLKNGHGQANGSASGSAPKSSLLGAKSAGSSSAVVVTTVVKKKILPGVGSARPLGGSSSSAGGSSSSYASGSNALSEEYRKRIAQNRERQARDKEAKEKAERARREQEHHAERERAKKRRRVAAADSSDEDDESNGGSAAHTPARKSASASAPASGAHTPSGRHSSGDEGSASGSTRRRGGGGASPPGYKKLGREGVAATYAVPRDDLAEELPFAETCAARGADTKFISAKQIVEMSGRHKYGTFFRDLPAEPVGTLEYPNAGASEEFLLLCPKSSDEYDPIAELLRTVYAVVAGGFLTPEQREELFGSLEDLNVSPTAGQQLSAAQLASGAAAAASVRRSGSATPSSREGSLAPSSAPGAAGDASPRPNVAPGSPASAAAMMRTGSSSANGSGAGAAASAPQDSILRSFTKARNRRDGPLFLATLARYNAALGELRASGALLRNVREQMTRSGVPEVVWRVVHEQTYARAVGPTVEELGKYEAFSDNVYGELLPRFMSEIAQLTQLQPKSVFLDLGSGVGNLLIQAALQTGCKALGCEIMKIPTEFADKQLAEARTRWCMWGLRGGEMESWRGDFCDDAKVRKAIAEADVVLVNNYAFTPSTNMTLSLQFLDLKDGAHIVSLKPFVPPDFRLTERTVSSPLAILRVVERIHTSGCVSWADRSGKYYIQTVDRSLVRKFYESRS